MILPWEFQQVPDSRVPTVQGGHAWSADSGAASPTIFDDQFFGPAGMPWDSKWNAWNVPGSLATQLDGGPLGGVMTLQPTGPAQHVGMYQPKAAVEFAAACKILLDGQGLTGSVNLIGGLIIAQDLAGAPATSPFYGMRFYGQDLVFQTWSNYQTFVATRTAIVQIQQTNLYLRVRVTATDVFTDWSSGGAEWREVDTISIAALGFTPAHVSLIGFNQSGVVQRVAYRTFQMIGGAGAAGYSALRLGQLI